MAIVSGVPTPDLRRRSSPTCSVSTGTPPRDAPEPGERFEAVPSRPTCPARPPATGRCAGPTHRIPHRFREAIRGVRVISRSPSTRSSHVGCHPRVFLSWPPAWPRPWCRPTRAGRSAWYGVAAVVLSAVTSALAGRRARSAAASRGSSKPPESPSSSPTGSANCSAGWPTARHHRLAGRRAPPRGRGPSAKGDPASEIVQSARSGNTSTASSSPPPRDPA